MGSVALPVSLPATTVTLDWSDELDELVNLLDWLDEFGVLVVLLVWSERLEVRAVLVVGLSTEKSPNESNRLPMSPNELSWFVICASRSPSLADEVCVERETTQ